MPSAKSIAKGALCLRNLESSKEVVEGEFLAWGGLMADAGSQWSKGAVGNPGRVSVKEVVMVFILVFHVYSTVILVDSPTSPSLGHLLPASPRGNLSPAPKPEAGSEGPGGALAPGQVALLLHHSVNLISK